MSVVCRFRLFGIDEGMGVPACVLIRLFGLFFLEIEWFIFRRVWVNFWVLWYSELFPKYMVFLFTLS